VDKNDCSILACRVPESFRECLDEAIGEQYDLVYVDDDDSASRKLHECQPIAMLTAPSATPDLDTPVRVACRLYPDLPVLLLAPTANPETFVTMQSCGIGAVLPPSDVLKPVQIELLFRHFLSPLDAPGIARFYPEGHRVEQWSLRDPAEREGLLKQLKKDFERSKWVDEYDLQLILEELVNNAALHAFRTPRDNPKYGPLPKGRLDEVDEVLVEWACEDLENGVPYGTICVRDNKGILAPGQIWKRLFRQSSQRGLLDTSGRGVYLAHLLTGFFGIAIRPGKWTEVTAFITPAVSNEQRPMSVRVVK
jgi:hypothetical protein